MDQTARAAFVISQAACMEAEIAAMKVTNRHMKAMGHQPLYTANDFRKLPAQYLVSHNQVIEYLRG